MGVGEKRPATRDIGDHALPVFWIEIAAGKRRLRRPRSAHGEEMREFRQCRFGEAAIGRDLAAVNGQQRGDAEPFIEGEHVVARDIVRIHRAVIVERADAGEGPYHIDRPHRFAKIHIGGFAQVVDLLHARNRRCNIADKIVIGGPDQRKILFEGEREHDARVRGLKHVAAAVVEQAPDDDMTALGQP